MVSSSWKRNWAAPTMTQLAIADQVGHAQVTLRARRDHDPQVRRRVVNQVGERLARAAGRRSASSMIRTTSSADCATSASQVVMPSRPGGRHPRAAYARRSAGRSRPAPPAPGSARIFAGRHRPGPTSQATTVPWARCSRRHWASKCRLAETGGSLHDDGRAVAVVRSHRQRSRCRTRRSRGTRGGVTLSSRLEAELPDLGSGCATSLPMSGWEGDARRQVGSWRLASGPVIALPTPWAVDCRSDSGPSAAATGWLRDAPPFDQGGTAVRRRYDLAAESARQSASRGFSGRAR